MLETFAAFFLTYQAALWVGLGVGIIAVIATSGVVSKVFVLLTFLLGIVCLVGVILTGSVSSLLSWGLGIFLLLILGILILVFDQ